MMWLTGYGIVLIDEIELHLHTTWQSRVLRTLFNTFPNIQFIITTHTPKVLGELDGNVNLIEMTNEGNAITAKSIPLLSGWDTNYILNNFMSTNPYNIETDQKITSIT